MSHFKLLTTNNNKILKSQKEGYLTFILHLAPSKLSGYNVCPKATQGCIAACLNTAGRGGMFKKDETTNHVQEARIRRTKLFFEDRDYFMFTLVKEIEQAIQQAKNANMIPVFRLNGTSDLSWEKYPVERKGIKYENIFLAFPEIQFYDYTAVLGRKVSKIPNYKLTFSRKESNDKDVEKAIENGMNVAVVFRTNRTKALPERYRNRLIWDGDKTDLRFLDPDACIVGLRAKGKAKKDNTGFVITEI